ncbi:MAG: peptidylprolyl isomerase [bacterium]
MRHLLARLTVTLAVGLVATGAPRAATPAPEDIPALDAWILFSDLGSLRVRIDREAAPDHVAQFLGLAANGWYDGLSVHRIVPRLVVQGGSSGTREGEPRDWVLVPPAERIPAEEMEAAALPRGTFALAWQGEDPGSAGSEWMITLTDLEAGEGRGTRIGDVVEGLDVLDRLAQVSTSVNDRPLKRLPFEVRLGPSSLPAGQTPQAPDTGSDEPQG